MTGFLEEWIGDHCDVVLGYGGFQGIYRRVYRPAKGRDDDGLDTVVIGKVLCEIIALSSPVFSQSCIANMVVAQIMDALEKMSVGMFWL